MLSTFARIGRSYPRARSEPAQAEHPYAGGLSHYRVTGALIAFLSALGLIGWLLSR